MAHAGIPEFPSDEVCSRLTAALEITPHAMPTPKYFQKFSLASPSVWVYSRLTGFNPCFQLSPSPKGDHQEVTVNRSRTQVEFYGFIIVNCDLQNACGFLGSHPHPGKDRRSGCFGFPRKQ